LHAAAAGLDGFFCASYGEICAQWQHPSDPGSAPTDLVHEGTFAADGLMAYVMQY
jgi:hypothetical protein